MLLVLLPRLATNVSVASSTNMLKKVEPSSTFCKNFFKFATLKFVARQVEHTVVIGSTPRSTRNATMLGDKLNKNVACITGRRERRSEAKCRRNESEANCRRNEISIFLSYTRLGSRSPIVERKNRDFVSSAICLAFVSSAICLAFVSSVFSLAFVSSAFASLSLLASA